MVLADCVVGEILVLRGTIGAVALPDLGETARLGGWASGFRATRMCRLLTRAARNPGFVPLVEERGSEPGFCNGLAGVSTEAQVIGGYRLINCVMTGQTSQVWEAVQEGSGRKYALKLLLSERNLEPGHRRLLAHEARVGRDLEHPNIIRVYEYVPDPDHPFFIMELFLGTNLRVRLQRKQALVVEKARRIIEQAGLGLAYMHEKRWLHCDVKPDNLLVNAVAQVKLIDFALAQRIKPAWQQRLRLGRPVVQGTRSYMSPEQIRGQALDERADVYSFGATLYEMVGGRPPYTGDTAQDLLQKHLDAQALAPSMLNKAVTPEFDELVLKMLAKRREERPRDVHEFLAALRNIKIFTDEATEQSEERGIGG